MQLLSNIGDNFPARLTSWGHVRIRILEGGPNFACHTWNQNPENKNHKLPSIPPLFLVGFLVWQPWPSNLTGLLLTLPLHALCRHNLPRMYLVTIFSLGYVYHFSWYVPWLPVLPPHAQSTLEFSEDDSLTHWHELSQKHWKECFEQ